MLGFPSIVRCWEHHYQCCCSSWLHEEMARQTEGPRWGWKANFQADATPYKKIWKGRKKAYFKLNVLLNRKASFKIHDDFKNHVENMKTHGWMVAEHTEYSTLSSHKTKHNNELSVGALQRRRTPQVRLETQTWTEQLWLSKPTVCQQHVDIYSS